MNIICRENIALSVFLCYIVEILIIRINMKRVLITRYLRQILFIEIEKEGQITPSFL